MSIIAVNTVAIMNTIEPVAIFVRDANGDPVDATNLSLTIMTTGNTVLIAKYIATSRIENPVLGKYVFDLGNDPGFDVETGTAQKLLFLWQADDEPTTVQTVAVVSVLTMMMIGRLQDQIDKSHKEFDEDPDNPVYLGYTPFQLFGYLEGGLQLVSAMQPYPTWGALDSFPLQIHGQVVVDAAILVGIHSQELYAIDTDIPNFSNQGNVFVIDHFPKLESYANALWARLEKIIPLMKLQYVSTGSLHIEAGPNFRLAQLLMASPSGANFRNVFTT